MSLKHILKDLTDLFVEDLYLFPDDASVCNQIVLILPQQWDFFKCERETNKHCFGKYALPAEALNCI